MSSHDLNELVENFKGLQITTYNYPQHQLENNVSDIDLTQNILILPDRIKDKLDSELIIQNMSQISLDLNNTISNYNKLLSIYKCTSQYMDSKNDIKTHTEFKKHLYDTDFTKTTYDFLIELDKFTEWDINNNLYNYMKDNTKILVDKIADLLDSIYRLLEEGKKDNEYIFLKTVDSLTNQELDNLMLYIHNITIGITYILLAYESNNEVVQNIEE